MRNLSLFCLLLISLGCSNSKPKGPIIEYYQPAYRQLPPEPVYSRVTWSHLPQPLKPKVRENAPLIMPEVVFDLPSSNLGVAVQALAQTIGYNWSYPPEAESRQVSIKMSGEVDAILRELGRQANVLAVLDHRSRVLRVISNELVSPATPQPSLPE